MLVNNEYSLYLYQGDSAKAFKVCAIINEVSPSMFDIREQTIEQLIKDILEGLKITDVIDDYDLGVNSTSWPQILK